MVGQPEADVVIGKGNGRDSILYRLRAMGVEVDSAGPEVDAVLARVKAASLKKHALLNDAEFRRIASSILGNGPRRRSSTPRSRQPIRRGRSR
jgi:isopropylmalate/homocitrate/citramalate synthase